MNIGVFTETYYPEINGVATSVYTLKQNLERQGHLVYVFTTKLPRYKAKEERVYRVSSISFKKTRRLGIFIGGKIKREAKRLGLDVVHIHTEFSLGKFGRKTAKKLRIPLVYTMHTLYENYTHYITKIKCLGRLLKGLVRKTVASYCNHADAVIAPTQKAKDVILSYNVKKDIFVVPTGINLDKFFAGAFDQSKKEAVLAELGINNNDKVIVNIGRLSQEKNIAELLLALKEYLPAHKDVKLLIIGEGPEKNALLKMTQDLGLGQQVIFAGPRPYDQIELYYKLGTVFIAASQSETQGLTFIEALACGVPIIAKEDKCLDGVLLDGENGYFFNDKQQLLNALDKTLFNEQQLQRLRQNAIKSVHKFSDAAFVDNVCCIYKDLLQKANS